MVKNHLKRLIAPKTWKIKRKGIKFIVRPNIGPHSLSTSMPITIVIRDLLGYAKTRREVKNILQNKEVLVDGIRRKDSSFPVGLFDVVRIKDTKEQFRVMLDNKGNIELLKIDEKGAGIKPYKIAGKTKTKKKTQLNLFDGRNIILDKDEYKVGDTVVVDLSKKEIKTNIAFKKGSMVYLIAGKHTGSIGFIEDIAGKKIIYKTEKGSVFETLKKYAFVIGGEKPAIKIRK